MKTKIIALFAGLLAVLPITSAWAATGYANLTVKVSPEGAGKVCVSTSKNQPDAASYKANEMTLVGSGSISSFWGITLPASITLYAWVDYDSEAYQFLGWSETEGGDAISTAIPKKHTISSSNTTSPGESYVLYANFKCLKTDPFSVKFTPTVHGVYTANGAEISAETESETQEMPYQVSFSATPEKPYEVDTWYAIDADGNETTFGAGQKTVSKTFTAKATVGVRFKARPIVTLTCVDAAGNYNVMAEGDAVDGAADQFYSQVKVTLQSDNPNFYSWTVNGKEVFDNPYVATVTADTTASATFLTSDMVADVSTYDELVAALANAGKKKITVPAGVSITIAKGAEVAVPAGRQLVVDGTLFVEGTLSNSGVIAGVGQVSKCVRLFTQTNKNGEWGPNAEPTVSWPSSSPMKVVYWVTTMLSNVGTVSGVSGVASHIAFRNGKGDYIRNILPDSNVPNVVAYACDSTVALNHVTGFSATSSNGLSGQNVLPGLKVLTGTVSYSTPESGRSKFAADWGLTDCAGNALTIGKELGGGSIFKVLNGSVAISGKVTGTNCYFINCSSVKALSFTDSSTNYAQTFRFFDTSVKVGTSGSVIKASYMKTGGDGMAFYSGQYDVDFSKTSLSKVYATTNAEGVVYAGSFKYNPGSYLVDSVTYEAVQRSSDNYWIVQVKKPPEYAVEANGVQYEDFAEAIAQSQSGVLRLLKHVELDAPVTIPAGKSITLELDGYNITGATGVFVNNGTLVVNDGSNNDLPSVVSASSGNLFVNNGTMEITCGKYSGAVLLNGGNFITHGGTFDVTLAAGLNVTDKSAVADLRGGAFKVDSQVTENVRTFGETDAATVYYGGFLDEGYVAVPHDGALWVGYGTYAIVTDISLGGMDRAWNLKALSKSDQDLYAKNPATRAACADDEEWRRFKELTSMIYPYQTKTIDCVLKFDRPVAAGSITAKVGSFTQSLAEDVAANAQLSVLIPRITQSQITYSRFVYDAEGTYDDVSCGLKNNQLDNIGTTCTVYLYLKTMTRDENIGGVWTYTYPNFRPIAEVAYRFVGKGAICGDMDYDSLEDALAVVSQNGTVKLSKDCAEQVVIGKEMSFTLDANNFAFTGEIKGDESKNLSVKRNGDVWTVFKKATDTPVVVKAADGEATVAAVELENTWKEKVIKDNGAEGKTEAEQQQIVQEELQKTEANGLKVWENKVLEQAAAKQALTKTGFAKVNKDEVTVDDKPVVATEVEEPVDAGNLANLETGVYQQTIIATDAAGNEIPIADTKATARAVVRNDSVEKTVVLAIPGDVMLASAIATAPREKDQIQVYDTEIQAYRCWEYAGSEWSPIPTTLNGVEVPNPTEAVDKLLLAGSVIRYVHSEMSDGQKVSVVADYKQDVVSEPLEKGSATDSKWNLMANPTGNAFDLEKIDANETSPDDKIIVLEKDGLGQTTYELNGDNSWGYYKTTTTKTKTGRPVATREWVDSGKDAVPAGRSMWYISNGGKPQFKWNKK